MQFDFNKLDDYKVALDDGGDLRFGVYHLSKICNSYNLHKIDWCCEFVFKEKDWETFKQKVADYFLN